MGHLGAPKSSKIACFGAPESTKTGRLSGPHLTKIGRLGASKMTKIGQNRPPRRPEISRNGYHYSVHPEIDPGITSVDPNSSGNNGIHGEPYRNKERPSRAHQDLTMPLGARVPTRTAHPANSKAAETTAFNNTTFQPLPRVQLTGQLLGQPPS